MRTIIAVLIVGAAIPAQPTILLQADFEGNFAPLSNTSLSSGLLYLPHPPTGLAMCAPASSTHTFVGGPQTWTDYSLEVDAFTPSEMEILLRMDTAGGFATNVAHYRIKFNAAASVPYVSVYQRNDIATFAQTIITVSAPMLQTTVWQRYAASIIGDQLTVSVDGVQLVDVTAPVSSPSQGKIGLRLWPSGCIDNLVVYDGVAPPPIPGNADLTLASDGMGTFTATLTSMSPGVPVYVVLDDTQGSVQIGFWGFTQIAIANPVMLSAPANTFGPSINPTTSTDANGDWWLSFWEGWLWYAYGLGDIYGEAYVMDTTAPNGLFYQSTLQTFTVQ